MKTKTNNATLTFIIQPSLIASTNCKRLDIFIKKNNKIIKNNYLFNARGITRELFKKRSLNPCVIGMDVLINNYNKKFYYYLNNVSKTSHTVFKRMEDEKYNYYNWILFLKVGNALNEITLNHDISEGITFNYNNYIYYQWSYPNHNGIITS